MQRHPYPETAVAKATATPAGKKTGAKKPAPKAGHPKKPADPPPADPHPAPHPRPKADHGPAAAARVKVRMYKLPIGDCFLLSFPKHGGGEFHALIDCGVIQGAEDPGALMTGVAGDIKARTGGALDLVLITHEHWDHVSGFSAEQAREVFEDITFKQLWLAWTEEPGDPLAARLRTERKARRHALELAVRRFGADAADGSAVGLAGALLAFGGGLGAAGKTDDALQWVKDHAGAENTRYCRPGDLLTLPGVAGVRVLVLGPPTDEALLRKSAPRSGANKETYLALADAEEQLRLALSGGDAGDPLAQAFDGQFRMTRAQARGEAFFRDHYGFDPGGPDEWRRVDADWLGMAGPLALQLDSDTNNTSLAVAVELAPGGDVLLFPGDAQVGNWLSWQSLTGWKDPDGADAVEGTVNDLFARTVLYKVGHHGSHNATLRADGLERMTGGRLVALVPVVEEFANTKKHWKMPFPDLFTRLNALAPRRVYCSDAAPASAGPGVTVTDRYVEVAI